MKKDTTEKKAKKIKELFVQDLARIEGGNGPAAKPSLKADCPEFTTLACDEEEGCETC